jgi:hypothetical protein
MAAQSTTINGPAARSLCWWMALAINSFPVPLGPAINTLERQAATWAIVWRRCCAHVDTPMISSKAALPTRSTPQPRRVALQSMLPSVKSWWQVLKIER